METSTNHGNAPLSYLNIFFKKSVQAAIYEWNKINLKICERKALKNFTLNLLRSRSNNVSNQDEKLWFNSELPSEAVPLRCSVSKVFWEISQNKQENTCARVSFLIKWQPEACDFIKKETLAQAFSCEFCEISINAFSYRTPPMGASVP